MNFIKKYFGTSERLDKDTLGKLGEKYSLHYLKKKNYQIVAKNYRTRLGEIDIIARQTDEFVFVEVKTREENLRFGDPRDSVTVPKQNRIKKMAQVYLDKQTSKEWTKCRFDIIEVILSRTGDLKTINHIIDAF